MPNTYPLNPPLNPHASNGPKPCSSTVRGLICRINTAVVLGRGMLEVLPELLNGRVQGLLGLVEVDKVMRIVLRVVTDSARLCNGC